MDLAWIAALTLLVAAEKLLQFGAWVARGAGLACLGGGAWLLLAQ
jgi:predicted metal-binding membrane protein